MCHLLICIKWNLSLSQQMVSVRHAFPLFESICGIHSHIPMMCCVFLWAHGLRGAMCVVCFCVSVYVCVLASQKMLQRARQGERLLMRCRQTKARRLWWKFGAFRAGGCLTRRSIFMAFHGECSVSILHVCVCVCLLYDIQAVRICLCVCGKSWRSLFICVFECSYLLMFVYI